jgi:Hemerythrin HHE cation binding domain
MGFSATIATPTTTDLRLQPVMMDLYRDIHKGIRSELFSITVDAGRLDPGVGSERVAMARRVTDLAELLESHARHEDDAIQPALEIHEAALAEQVERDHVTLERRFYRVVSLAEELADEVTVPARHAANELYLGLASFTCAYLAHQDVEERVIMPALERAIGVEAVVAIHGAIVGSIPPAEMADTLAKMLPAMNIDDRVELLGGMKMGAPPEAFAGIVAVANEVIGTPETMRVLNRLG